MIVAVGAGIVQTIVWVVVMEFFCDFGFRWNGTQAVYVIITPADSIDPKPIYKVDNSMRKPTLVSWLSIDVCLLIVFARLQMPPNRDAFHELIFAFCVEYFFWLIKILTMLALQPNPPSFQDEIDVLQSKREVDLENQMDKIQRDIHAIDAEALVRLKRTTLRESLARKREECETVRWTLREFKKKQSLALVTELPLELVHKVYLFL